MADLPQAAARPIKLPVRNHPESAPSHAQPAEYEFVLSTGNKKSVDANARRTIRSRVMRNYVQEKKGEKQDVSLMNSDSALKARTTLKGKFRLKPREQQEEGERNPQQSRKRKSLTTVESTSSDHANTAAAVSNSIPTNPYQDAFGSSSSVVQAITTEPSQSVNTSVATIPRFQENRFDPFNVLPVPGGPRLDRLLYLYNNHFSVNSNAVNPTRTWYGYVLSDNVLLHAMLSTVALFAWKYNGLDTKPDMLYHHGHALRKLNVWLHALEAAPLDLVIAAVCTAASFEHVQGNYEIATTHVTALKTILARHGSLSAIQSNDTLQRAIAWTSYHSAAVNRKIPFYQLEPSISAEFPDELLLQAVRNAPTSTLNIPSYGFEIYNILHRIHRLGIALSRPWLDTINMVAFSNTLHDAEYDMLVLSAKLAVNNPSRGNGSSIANALVVTCLIFDYGVLRSLPFTMRTIDLFLQRLIAELDQDELLETWTEQCTLEALLWVICVGLMVSVESSTRNWFKERMIQVVQLLQVADFADLEGILKGYAWSDFCRFHLESHWNEVFATGVILYSQEIRA